MEKKAWLKYIGFTIIFVALLIIPIESKFLAWSILIGLIFVFIWIFNENGNPKSWLYFAGIFLFILFLSEMGSKLYNWMIALFIISVAIWAIKKWL